MDILPIFFCRGSSCKISLWSSVLLRYITAKDYAKMVDYQWYYTFWEKI